MCVNPMEGVTQILSNPFIRTRMNALSDGWITAKHIAAHDATPIQTASSDDHGQDEPINSLIQINHSN